MCAAAAVLLVVGVLRPPPPTSWAVVVAAGPLAAGGVLESSDLRVSRVLGPARPVASVDDPRRLVGRRLGTAVAAGEEVTATRLVPRSVADGLPRGTVAASLAVADPRSLELVSAGRRVTVYADTGGPPLARDVLVLGTDTPDPPVFPGSLPNGDTAAPGLLVALTDAEVDRVFAGQRLEGGPPRVLAVVTG